MESTADTPGPGKPPAFERVEEYKAVLDNLAAYSARRQTTNDVYVGLNTLFLTAIAFFITTQWNSRPTALVIVAGSLAILPINLTWYGALRRYDVGIRQRLQYLQEIEAEFLARRGYPADSLAIGLYRRLQKPGYEPSAHTLLELRLALYFVLLYPLVALAMCVLTYLSATHIIAPIRL